jgi:phosphate transport system substrate-binding protein
MGKKQEDLQGLGVFGDPGVAEAVRQDVLGIGFNNVNYAYDATTKKPMDQLAVLPLDVNENGVIDPEESFYEDRDALTAAIAAGRYPSPPARDLYLVSKGPPAKKEVVAFLRWILTEGQVFVPEAGYVNLSAESIAAEIKKLDE